MFEADQIHIAPGWDPIHSAYSVELNDGRIGHVLVELGVLATLGEPDLSPRVSAALKKYAKEIARADLEDLLIIGGGLLLSEHDLTHAFAK